MSERVWRYGPLLLWLLFISFASTGEFSADNTSIFVRPFLLWFFPDATEATLANLHSFIRKAGHFFEYAVLGYLARRAFVGSSNSFIRQRWFELGLAIVVLNALLDELHQSFVPTRTASIYDSLIDILGGLTVLLIFRLFAKRHETVIA